MPGTIPSTLHVLTHLYAYKPEEAGAVIIPILQMKKVRQREVPESLLRVNHFV